MTKPTYFTTADARVIRGEAVSLPVLAINHEVGIAEYAGEASTIDDAIRSVWAMGFKPLRHDHRPSPTPGLKRGLHSVIASNGETYHEWIEVPVAAKVTAA